MLPALDMFRPKGRDLQGRGAFLRYGIPMPSVRNAIASLAFFAVLWGALPTTNPNRYAPASRKHIPYDLYSLQGFRPSGFLDYGCARNDNHFCHLERSDSGVERSRVRRTFAGTVRKGSCHFTVEPPRLRSG